MNGELVIRGRRRRRVILESELIAESLRAAASAGRADVDGRCADDEAVVAAKDRGAAGRLVPREDRQERDDCNKKQDQRSNLRHHPPSECGGLTPPSKALSSQTPKTKNEGPEFGALRIHRG